MAEMQATVIAGCAADRARTGSSWPRARVSITGVVHPVQSADEWAKIVRGEWLAALIGAVVALVIIGGAFLWS